MGFDGRSYRSYEQENNNRKSSEYSAKNHYYKIKKTTPKTNHQLPDENIHFDTTTTISEKAWMCA